MDDSNGRLQWMMAMDEMVLDQMVMVLMVMVLMVMNDGNE